MWRCLCARQESKKLFVVALSTMIADEEEEQRTCLYAQDDSVTAYSLICVIECFIAAHRHL